MKKNIQGFTIIEALIFIGVLSMFFVAAISISTSMLRNMKSDEHRLIANRYAQEAYEWIRSQKEIDWTEFYSNTPGIYCLPETLSFSNDVSGIDDCGYDLPSFDKDGVFRRWVQFTHEGSDNIEVKVTITVEWVEGQVPQDVTTETTFSVWDDVVN